MYNEYGSFYSSSLDYRGEPKPCSYLRISLIHNELMQIIQDPQYVSRFNNIAEI